MRTNPLDDIRDDALAALGLPEVAYADNSKGIYCAGAKVIAIKRGENGFYPIYTQLTADQLNESAGVSSAQREAMITGSMFGWETKGADPKSYEKLSKEQQS